MTDARRYGLTFLLSFLAFTALFAMLGGSAFGAPAVPDPLDRPVEFGEALGALHQNGGLYVMIAVAIAAIARTVAQRLRPDPGVPADGWRSRTITTMTTVALLAAGLADLLLGSLSGAGFALVAAGGAGLIMDPRDRKPPSSDGSAAKVGAAALVLMVLLTSCAQVRPRAGAAAQAGLDCQRSNIAAVVHEAGALARAAVLAAITGDGKPDTAALRSAARGLQSDALRCAFAAAVAALAAPGVEDPDAPQTLGLEIDGPALRAAVRELAATEWGVSGPIVTADGVL